MTELPSHKPVQEIKKLLDDLLAFYQSQITCECLDCPWRTSFEKLVTLIPAVLESNDKYLELAHNQFLTVKAMDVNSFFRQVDDRIEDVLAVKGFRGTRRKESGTYVVIED